MKFFCETYHEERDTEHCGFCSAACSQRPIVETATGTGEHNKKGEIITGKIFMFYSRLFLNSSSHQKGLKYFNTIPIELSFESDEDYDFLVDNT